MLIGTVRVSDLKNLHVGMRLCAIQLPLLWFGTIPTYVLYCLPLVILGQGRIKEGVPSCSASQVIRQLDKDPPLWQELTIGVTFKESLPDIF